MPMLESAMQPVTRVMRAERAYEYAQLRVVEAVGMMFDHPDDAIYRYALRSRYRECQLAESAFKALVAA